MKPVKLEEFVNASIYMYPSLYKNENHEKSRIQVLDHIFLVIGNGLEWHPDGFLAHTTRTRKGDVKYLTKLSTKKLPENFYDYDLYYVDVTSEDLPKVKKILGKRFYYTRPPMHGDIEVIFDADNNETLIKKIAKYSVIDEAVERINKKFKRPKHIFPAMSCYHPKSLHNRIRMLGISEEVVPYGMCKYSAVVEMINGKTCSCHINNFEVTQIQPDWIQGAMDIILYTKEFYSDPKRYVQSHSHPSKSLVDFKRIYDSDPKRFIEERKAEGMTRKTSIEDWCNICWERFLKEQLDYCNKFIRIYKNKLNKNEKRT